MNERGVVSGDIATLWRNRGYDDGAAGRDRRADVPDEHRSVYFTGYRRGKEQADRLAAGDES